MKRLVVLLILAAAAAHATDRNHDSTSGADPLGSVNFKLGTCGCEEKWRQ